jgi:hypothetical protein
MIILVWVCSSSKWEVRCYIARFTSELWELSHATRTNSEVILISCVCEYIFILYCHFMKHWTDSTSAYASHWHVVDKLTWWLRIVNRGECGRKQSWPIWNYFPRFCKKELRKITRTSASTRVGLRAEAIVNCLWSLQYNLVSFNLLRLQETSCHYTIPADRRSSISTRAIINLP